MPLTHGLPERICSGGVGVRVACHPLELPQPLAEVSEWRPDIVQRLDPPPGAGESIGRCTTEARTQGVATWAAPLPGSSSAAESAYRWDAHVGLGMASWPLSQVCPPPMAACFAAVLASTNGRLSGVLASVAAGSRVMFVPGVALMSKPNSCSRAASSSSKLALDRNRCQLSTCGSSPLRRSLFTMPTPSRPRSVAWCCRTQARRSRRRSARGILGAGINTSSRGNQSTGSRNKRDHGSSSSKHIVSKNNKKESGGNSSSSCRNRCRLSWLSSRLLSSLCQRHK